MVSHGASKSTARLFAQATLTLASPVQRFVGRSRYAEEAVATFWIQI
ncbi:MAG: hypothetical protein M3Q00_09955 [Pseudomonadota bacterium]|nr:hypothetical protein [Pseudomonadota bacterium]